MSPWTQGAEELWNEFTEKARKQLIHSDIDPDEVLDDMRRHVETELGAQNLTVITTDDLKKVLDRLELPETKPAVPDMSPLIAKNDEKAKPAYQALLSAFGGFYIVTFGVLLPLAAATFELATRICSEIFFNPLPTIWHVLLFFTVPMINLAGYTAVRLNKPRSIRLLGYLNGLSIGVSLFYTILFLPILPFSVIAIIAIGIGFCGLAPLLSFIATLLVRKRLRLMVTEQNISKVPLLWSGVSSGFGLLIILVIPTVAAIIGLNMAVSSEPGIQAKGVGLLRTFASKQYLLKQCYRTGGRELFGFDVTGTGEISTEEIRGIYYKVTGKSFNTERPQTSILGNRNTWIDDWDFEQAGDIVGGQLRDLALVSSQMDANLDADGAVGYLEWVMTFQNDHQWQEREARCQIQLPPGGVVSRLTLWIDGQECEAAFGGRSQTKNAYKSVVRRQRDPVLVTTKGPDQVLMQCFPVPANGGKMKVRVGITFPLDLLSREQALLQLPYINEHNFQIPETTEHHLWVEADGELSTKLDLTTEAMPDKGRYAIRGVVTNGQLIRQQASIRLMRNPETMAVWAKRDFDNEQVTILQKLHNNKGNALIDKAVIVIDTSKAMKSYVQAISAVLNELKPQFDVEVIFADDIPKTASLSDDSVKKLLRERNCRGGKDNMPALMQAWDRASESETSAIVWIHSAQPHTFEPADPLLQRWMRRPDGPTLIHLQTSPGPNKIIEEMDGVSQIRVVARSCDIQEDLKRVFGQLNGTIPRCRMSREQVLPEAIEESVPRASSHVVRLWARDEVETLRTQRGNARQNQAKAIAVKHQLVTPVSGAVVLESQEQYERNNLQPVDSETVPTIPEPATLALLACGAALMRSVHHRKKRRLTVAR